MLGTTRILLYVYVLRSLYELIDSIVTLYLSSARPHTLIDYRPFIVPRKSPFNWRTPADLFFPFLLTLNTSKQRSKANKELVPKPDFTHSSSIYFMIACTICLTLSASRAPEKQERHGVLANLEIIHDHRGTAADIPLLSAGLTNECTSFAYIESIFRCSLMTEGSGYREYMVVKALRSPVCDIGPRC